MPTTEQRKLTMLQYKLNIIKQEIVDVKNIKTESRNEQGTEKCEVIVSQTMGKIGEKKVCQQLKLNYKMSTHQHRQ